MGFTSSTEVVHGGGSRAAAGRPSRQNTAIVQQNSYRVSAPWVLRDDALADELQMLIGSALEWRNLVRLMWVELGRPQVPGFPASRVQQILWGELPPEGGFFAALLGALTTRARPASRSAFSWRDYLAHSADSATRSYVEAEVNAYLKAARAAQREMLAAGAELGSVNDASPAPRGAASQSEEAAQDAAEQDADTVVRAVVLTNPVVDHDRMQKIIESMVPHRLPPDPDLAETVPEFVQALRQLKGWSGQSLRQLEESSKATTAGWLPRATAGDMLRRSTLPKPDVLWSFTAACGLSAEEEDRWEAARSRLNKQRRIPQLRVESMDGFKHDAA